MNFFFDTEFSEPGTGNPPTIELISISIVSEDGLWAYYASYDWVVFCWLLGAMVDLPEGFPMLPMDLQQQWIWLGRPDGMKPKKPSNQHNALADAKWNKAFHDNLKACVDTAKDQVQEAFKASVKAYAESTKA